MNSLEIDRNSPIQADYSVLWSDSLIYYWPYLTMDPCQITHLARRDLHSPHQVPHEYTVSLVPFQFFPIEEAVEINGCRLQLGKKGLLILEFLYHHNGEFVSSLEIRTQIRAKYQCSLGEIREQIFSLKEQFQAVPALSQALVISPQLGYQLCV